MIGQPVLAALRGEDQRCHQQRADRGRTLKAGKWRGIEGCKPQPRRHQITTHPADHRQPEQHDKPRPANDGGEAIQRLLQNTGFQPVRHPQLTGRTRDFGRIQRFWLLVWAGGNGHRSFKL